MARTTVLIAGRPFPNGRVDTSLLIDTGTPRGALLERGAAASWARLGDDVQARHGWRPRMTSAGDGYRPDKVQERVFLERYEVRPASRGNGPYGDVRYWKGLRFVRVRGAAAAVPGTSNHGCADTTDVEGLGGFGGLRYQDFAPIAHEHGWDNAEGRSVGEAWHWRYYPARDRHAHRTPTTTVTDTGDDMPSLAEIDALIKQNTANSLAHIIAMLGEVPGRSASAVWDRRVMRLPGVPLEGQPTALQELANINTTVSGLGPADVQPIPMPVPDIDEEALAVALAPLLTAQGLAAISDADVQRIAQAATDEADRRERARLGDA